MNSPVLVVGAGPSGLICAIALARRGIPVRIFDQGPGVNAVSRAVVVQPRTIELYRQLDPALAARIVQEGQICSGFTFWVGGRLKASIAYDEVGSGANASPAPRLLVLPQDAHERVLAGYLEETLGVKIERNMTVTSVNVDEHSAVWNDGEKTECSAQFAFIVGADGIHSTVRRSMGSQFEGSTSSLRYFVADVECAALPEPTHSLHLHQGRDDFLFVAPYAKPGRARLVGVVEGDREVSSWDDIRLTSLDEWNLQVKDVAWFSTYKVAHKVADVWQRGRVAITGDAAHVHSPVGGQGMNTGIGDSINLAWKIAAVLKNEALSSVLLPTYTAERRGFAIRLVSTTDRIFTWTLPGSFIGDAIRLYIFPTVAGLIWRFLAVRKKVYATTAQFNLNYRACDFNLGTVGALGGGDRLPYHPVQDNWKGLNDLKWHLHTFGVASAENEALATWCTKNHIVWDKFDFDEIASEAGFMDGCVLLVRPDMHIGFAGIVMQGDEDIHGVIEALERYTRDRLTGRG